MRTPDAVLDEVFSFLSYGDVATRMLDAIDDEDDYSDLDDDEEYEDRVHNGRMAFLELVRKYNPLQPRDPGGKDGGRWIKGGGVLDRLIDALKGWADGGQEDPLEGIKDREQLRRLARKQGITLKRGAPIDDIKKALRDHAKTSKVDKPDAEKDAPDEAPKKAAAKSVREKRRLELLATIDKGEYPGRGLQDVEDLGALQSAGLIEKHAESPHGWRLTGRGRARLDDVNAPDTPEAKEKAAVDRQARIDKVRGKAEALAEALEMVANVDGVYDDASVKAMKHRINARHTRGSIDDATRDRLLQAVDDQNLERVVKDIAEGNGLTMTAHPGDVLPWKRNSGLRAIGGGGFREGTYVHVVKPGVRYDPGDGEVLVAEGVAEEATPDEIAEAKRLADRKKAREAEKATPDPAAVKQRLQEIAKHADLETAEDEAGQYLDSLRLTAAQMKALAQGMDVPLIPGSKTQHRKDILKVLVSGHLTTRVLQNMTGLGPKTGRRETDVKSAPNTPLADLPDDQRRNYEAILRNAADGGTTKSLLGASSAARQRNDHIDELVDSGYLKQDGESFTLTDRGRQHIGDATPFSDQAAEGKFGRPAGADLWEAGQNNQAVINEVTTVGIDADAERKLLRRYGVPESEWPERLQSAATATPTADPSESLRDELDLKKVPELKDMLRKAGLPVSGRKRELVDRLVEHQAGGVGPKADAGLTGDQQEQAARDRLARIDAVRGKADTVAEALELLDSEASEKAMKHRINARLARGSIDEPTRDRLLAAVDDGNLAETVKALAAENGFTLTAQPGDVVAWKRDSGLLSPSRHGFREGQMVRVFRPGVQYDPGDGRVLIVQGLAEEATPEEIAAARATPRAFADFLTRAFGADVTPGHDQLHHYWTKGEGLAKWAASPHPWTTLVGLLTEHVGPEKAKVFASKWFHEVFGYWSGHRKGDNPVGPG